MVHSANSTWILDILFPDPLLHHLFMRPPDQQENQNSTELLHYQRPNDEELLRRVPPHPPVLLMAVLPRPNFSPAAEPGFSSSPRPSGEPRRLARHRGLDPALTF
jgi:hypothetical protein